MENMWRYIRGKISPVLVKGLFGVVGRMSKPGLLALGRRLGLLIYYVSRNHRRRSLDNLNIAFGKSKSRNEMKRIAKAAFQDFAKSGLETLMIDASPESFLRKLVAVEGLDHLKRALAAGKGVIGLTAHFGNFIALHGRLGIEGYTVNCVVKAMRDKGVEEILQRMRSEQNMKTIYVSPQAKCVRACREALAANEILILLNDQPQKNGVCVEFMGEPVWTAAGPATLALNTGAAVVPMFMVRNPDDTHRLIISEQASVSRTDDRKQDVIVNTQAFTRITESYVLNYPEQWAWNQRRWRRWK